MKKLEKAIKEIKEAEIKPIQPIYNDLNIATLIQQLNSLIDQYITIYNIYSKPFFAAEERNPANRLVKVLDIIEKAIDALCFRITTYQGILTIKA